MIAMLYSWSAVHDSFEGFDKHHLSEAPYIDVWPLRVKYSEGFDNTFMLVLQLACVLHMKQDWKSHTKIRIFVIIESELYYTVILASFHILSCYSA